MELALRKTMTLKSTVVQTQFWVGYTDVDPTKICVKLS